MPMFEQVVLYHSVIDARSRFIRSFLSAKGIDFSLSAFENWHTANEILCLNPARKIPILTYNEGVIIGVVPIVETVNENYAQGSMFGTTVKERAENRRLLDWFFHKFEPEVYTPILYTRYYKKGNINIISQGRKNMSAHIKYIEDMLLCNMFGADIWRAANKDEKHTMRQDAINIPQSVGLCAEKLGIADYCAGAYISSLDYFGEILWADYPILKSWYQRIKVQPHFAPILNNLIPTHSPPIHYKQADF